MRQHMFLSKRMSTTPSLSLFICDSSLRTNRDQCTSIGTRIVLPDSKQSSLTAPGFSFLKGSPGRDCALNQRNSDAVQMRSFVNFMSLISVSRKYFSHRPFALCSIKFVPLEKWKCVDRIQMVESLPGRVIPLDQLLSFYSLTRSPRRSYL